MRKVICDICGTQYPETAEQCPICGFARDQGGADVSDDLLTQQPQSERPRVRGGRFSASNVRKRNRNTPSYQPHLTDDEDENYQPGLAEKESNKALVVVLAVLIVAVLAVTGFIFVKYLLPNLGDDQQDEQIPQTSETQGTSETTEPTIPCTSLSLTSGGSKELTEPGQYWLINVVVMPEDTTDVLKFTSSDESVATVTDEGRVEAIGEGEATITVTCGEKQLDCFIVCVFPEETEPETTVPEETEPEPVTMTVTAEKLSIRSGAGTDQEKIGVYRRGEEVVIYETVIIDGANWGRTDKGWICIDYCK